MALRSVIKQSNLGNGQCCRHIKPLNNIGEGVLQFDMYWLIA